MHFCLVGEYEILAEVHFRLAEEIRGFAKEYSLSAKNQALSKNFTYPKPYIFLRKTQFFSYQKFLGFSGAFFKKPPEWGMGQRPIEEGEARGSAPNPASFLKRKSERRISRKRCFRQGGLWIFAGIRFCMVENMRFSGNTFPLGKENKSFCESTPLDRQ